MSWRNFEFFAPREEGPLAIAHSSAIFDDKDSSIEVIRNAILAGLRFVEIDLRATADGRLVVWHGTGIERLRPDLPLKLDVVVSRQVIPFEEVLEEVPPATCFFVDLKDRFAGEALARIVRRMHAEQRICVGSFSHARTMAGAAAITRVTGYTPPTSLTPRQLPALLRQTFSSTSWKPEFVSVQIPSWMATERVVRAAHRGGSLVFPWTVNDADTMHTLLGRGTDGIITDFPLKLISILGGGSSVSP